VLAFEDFVEQGVVVIKLIVPLEAPPEVAALLLQAVQGEMISGKADAASVWKELVSIAALEVPENMERQNKKLKRLHAERAGHAGFDSII
jgi:hypothetical protein